MFVPSCYACDAPIPDRPAILHLGCAAVLAEFAREAGYSGAYSIDQASVLVAGYWLDAGVDVGEVG